jgi:hypothetical protein
MVGSFVKGALIGGLGAALVLVTSAAIAGTGIGAPFNLGETNNVDETSVLTGDKAGGKMLQVTNTSTAPGEKSTTAAAQTSTSRSWSRL